MNAQEIFAKIRGMIADEFRVDEESITLETSFDEDLGADSVDLVEFVMAMEDEFDIGEVDEEDLAELKTVGACVNFLASKMK